MVSKSKDARDNQNKYWWSFSCQLEEGQLGFYCSWSWRLSGLMAGAGSIDVVHDAQCAEMVAWMIALEAASVNGMMRIIIETDCSCLVSALKSTALIKLLLVSGLWTLEFLWVSISYLLMWCLYPVIVIGVLMRWHTSICTGTWVSMFGLTPSRTL